jgi:hypothetical protein
VDLFPVKIFSFQRTMEYEAALRKLGTAEGLGMVRHWLNGSLRGIAEIYIPYRLYKVTLDDRRVQSVRYYAVDAAVGTLDPYEFATAPEANACVELDTRNFHPVRLSESETRKMAVEKVRRLLYSRGFLRLTNPDITAELIKPEFYLPYWAGFYGNGQNISIRVLNAVQETMEGSKLRHLLKTWLLENSAEVFDACVAHSPSTVGKRA